MWTDKLWEQVNLDKVSGFGKTETSGNTLITYLIDSF